MSHAALFVAALLARGFAIVALSYSDWLLRILTESCQVGYEVLIDLGEFLNYLRETVTHQVFGYQSNY